MTINIITYTLSRAAQTQIYAPFHLMTRFSRSFTALKKRYLSQSAKGCDTKRPRSLTSTSEFRVIHYKSTIVFFFYLAIIIRLFINYVLTDLLWDCFTQYVYHYHSRHLLKKLYPVCQLIYRRSFQSNILTRTTDSFNKEYIVTWLSIWYTL